MITHTNIPVDIITGCVFHTQFLASSSIPLSFLLYYSTHSNHSSSAFLRAYTDHSLYPLALHLSPWRKERSLGEIYQQSCPLSSPITLSTHTQKAKDPESLGVQDSSLSDRSFP